MNHRKRLSGARYFARVRAENFEGADLASVRLDHLRLDRCVFVAADLRHATLDNCSFKLCDLRGANLRGASARFVDFSGCDLRSADLRDCDLTGAGFRLVSTGADNGLTDLTGTTLDGAVLTGTSFERTVGYP